MISTSSFETPQPYGSLRRKTTSSVISSPSSSITSFHVSSRRTTRFEVDNNIEEQRLRTDRAVAESILLRAALAKQRVDALLRTEQKNGLLLIQRLASQNQMQRIKREHFINRINQTTLLKKILNAQQKSLLIGQLTDLKNFKHEVWTEFMELSQEVLNQMLSNDLIQSHYLTDILNLLSGEGLLQNENNLHDSSDNDSINLTLIKKEHDPKIEDHEMFELLQQLTANLSELDNHVQNGNTLLTKCTEYLLQCDKKVHDIKLI